jgi:Trehalose receptor.
LKYAFVSVAFMCSYNETDHLKLYYLIHYRHVFEFIKFSPPVAFLCEIVNFYAAFYWNFVDLFVMVLSMAIASRFRLLNSHLKLEIGKVRVDFIRNICDFVMGNRMR